MTDDVIKLVEYRLRQASETLQVAHDLAVSDRRRDAINRAYYAMFYAGLGLLASRLLGTSRHSGVLSLFGEHFVKTGLFSAEAGRHMRQAFDLRQKCDYQVFAEPTTEQMVEVLQYADSFIAEAGQVWRRMRLEEPG
jgi:uncharacterized protein (UPF0332 family)